MKKNLKLKKKGFSLVELMVVIAIITILAAIAVPMYSNYQTRAKLASELSAVGEVKSKIAEILMVSHGTTTISSSMQDIEKPNYITISSGGTITMDIGSNGSGTIDGNANLTLTPTDTSSSLTWVCTATGSNLNSTLVPSSCSYS